MSHWFEQAARNASRSAGTALYQWVFDIGTYQWNQYSMLTEKEQEVFVRTPIKIPDCLEVVERQMRDFVELELPDDAAHEFIPGRDRKPVGRYDIELPYLYFWML